MKCLIEFRKAQGKTRQEMAEALGVSHSLYEKVELGDRQPSRNFFEKFKATFPTFDMNVFFKEMLHDSCKKSGTTA